MHLHFPNNAPFAKADYLEREIEVRCYTGLRGLG